MNYRFQGSMATAQGAYHRNIATAAFTDWQNYLDYNGQHLWYPQYNDPGYLDVYDDSSLPALGVTECGSDKHRIRLNLASIYNMYNVDNNTYADYEAALRWVARHEMGHAAGLQHTGLYRSYVDTVPTMTVYLDYAQVQDAAYGLASQDDQQQLARTQSLLPGPIAANFGFETGSTNFATTPGSSISWRSSGGATGLGNIFVQSDSAADYVYQTAEYFNAPSKQFQAVMNVKRASPIPTDLGTGTAELWARDIGYPAESPSTCNIQYTTWDPTYQTYLNYSSHYSPNQWEGGKCMNDLPNSYGPWMLRASGSGSVGASWSGISTPNWTSSSPDLELQVRVRQNMSSKQILLDNVRLSCANQASGTECS